MLEKLKAKMFPCTERINKAIADNRDAMDRLNTVCCIPSSRQAATFPPLKDGHIVNPR